MDVGWDAPAESCIEDGRLLTVLSCSNDKSSSTGEGGNGFSGVFGRRFGEPTSVERLPKLRVYDRLTLVESDPYSKLLSAEDDSAEDRVLMDIL